MDPAEAIAALQARIRACRACAYAHGARPVVEGTPGARILLIGQAPGKVEEARSRPWSGPAGRRLVKWMTEGVRFASEEEFRRHVYLSAVTRCFPGPSPSGHGDRRPGPREIENCAPHLAAELDLLRPALVLVVGGLAIERLMGKVKLDDVVGRTFPMDFPGPPKWSATLVPLPHPSGASTWLVDEGHKALLAQGLAAARGIILAQALAPL